MVQAQIRSEMDMRLKALEARLSVAQSLSGGLGMDVGVTASSISGARVCVCV